MAEYNGNDIYLRVNAVDVEGRWREFDMSLDRGDEDVSAGAGIEWEKHNDKLKSVKAKLSVIYDDVAAAADFAALWTVTGKVAVIYGPEGSATGKPCHNQSFLITSISGPTTGHDKPAVMVEMDMISTGVPTKNIYAGDTF
jgi:hypothetical protein